MKKTTTLLPIALILAGVMCAAGAASSGCSSGSSGGSPAQAFPAGIAQIMEQTNIVSNQERVGNVLDTTLVNAWGLAFNPAGAAWVAANGSGISEVYSATGQELIPRVTIPPPNGKTGPSAPTGVAFNPTSAMGTFKGDAFIFVTEDGTISGWQQSDQANATLRLDNSATGAVYKGVALAVGPQGTEQIFVTNFNSGAIEVYDNTFTRVALPAGTFTDSNLPAGFAPFNAAASNGIVLVTYARQDPQKHDDVAGVGNGFVDAFTVGGTFVTRLITQGVLNSPWGLAVTPPNFGSIGSDLLVGNFGDGLIHVYSVNLTALDASAPSIAEANLVGALGSTTGNPLIIDGVWSLAFGVNAGGFNANTLYFTAGPNKEANGLFGFLVPVP